MLDEMFNRRDVKNLLNEICFNNRYTNKQNQTTIDYESYVDKEQPLYLMIDALYKFKVIIDDEMLLDEYITDLKRLMKKLNNFSDIEIGINNILGRLTARKLNISNIKDDDYKKEILKYIYDKYIVNGYMFHSIPSVYKEQILQNGIIPEQYNNMYDNFKKVKEILNNHNAGNVMEKDFDEDYIIVTDSLKKAYYYATNTPMYFSYLLSNNYLMKNKKYKKDAYYRKDYDACMKNLTKLCRELDLTIKETKYIKQTCTEEWNLLKNNYNIPTVLMIKRSVIGNNFLKDIDSIIDSASKAELSELIDKILNSRYNKEQVKKHISSEDIDVIELFSYKEIYEKADISTTVDDFEFENIIENTNEDFINNYGKVSVLLLLGSMLITLGVLITIIKIGRGL